MWKLAGGMVFEKKLRQMFVLELKEFRVALLKLLVSATQCTVIVFSVLEYKNCQPESNTICKELFGFSNSAKDTRTIVGFKVKVGNKKERRKSFTGLDKVTEKHDEDHDENDEDLSQT